MAIINFLERYRNRAEWNDIMQKSRAVKYLRRYPKKTGKGYNYVYKDSWKKPFKALLECFGIKKTKVEEDYSKNDIKKNYGADKDTFAAHVLEYFTNKLKWDNLFSKKENREKYKKPITQATVKQQPKGKTVAEKRVQPVDTDKMIVNRSLMRKVWTIYSPIGKQIESNEKNAKNIERAEEKLNNAESKANKKGITATYREQLKENLHQYFYNPIKNISTGIEAYISGKSVDKMSSDKAIQKSKNNGFTVEQHFEVCNDIVNLFKNSELISTNPDSKGSKNLLSIKRFIANTVLSNGENARAYITVKESIEQGHKIYSVEVMDIKKASNNVDAKGDSVDKINPSRDQELNLDDLTIPQTSDLSSDLQEHENRSRAMLGNDNAKKDGLTTEEVIEKYKNKYYAAKIGDDYAPFFYVKEGENLESSAVPYSNMYKTKKGCERAILKIVEDESRIVDKDIVEAELEQAYHNDLQKNIQIKDNFNLLNDIFNTGETSFVNNKEIGDIAIELGETGKQGYGLKHIIEQRYTKDKMNVDDITALCYLIVDTAKNGKVTRETKDRVELQTDNGIVTIVKTQSEKGYKWVLTGFDNWNKKTEATEAIKTVNAQDSYAFERSYFREQVGAVIASLSTIPQNTELSNGDEHENRSRAMLGNDNAKKDFIEEEEKQIYNTNREVQHGTDNIKIEQSGLSTSIEDIRAGGSEGTSDTYVSNNGRENNGNESLLGIDESGGRLGNADSVNAGRGRITKGQARKIREQCREILKKKDSEITEADKIILSQYVGAGGTDEENSSNSGVLYEFYTPRNVISKVWEIVDKYNPRQDKTVIEPSAGIGRFAENRDEKITMFELEEESSRIAKILHPNAEVVTGAFQENFLKNKNGRFTKDFKKYDVAVGNPPYGSYTGKYKGLGEGKDYKRYETYFMSRTLDTLENGGIMAMVVPSGFMDGKSTYGKDIEKICQKAELLEAWRLPNGTFESTDVGTDIVVFKKGKGSSVESITKYFENNPDHIQGEVATRNGRFGEETYIKCKDGETFESAINNIKVDKTEIENTIKQVSETTKVKEEPVEAKTVTSKTIYGDVVKTDKGTGRVTGYIQRNRKTVGVKVNVDGVTQDVLFTEEQQEKRSRSEAMKGNQNAKGEHDYPINPNAHIMDVAEFNKKYDKDIDVKDMPIWKVTDKFGNIDFTKLSESEKEYVKSSDHFVKEGETYVNVVNYASGNVRQKLLDLDENDPQYELKKSLLEDVCPEEKKLEQIRLSPIIDWVKEYKTKDGMDLISGFKQWAGHGGSASSPITREEMPSELNWYDIEDFIRKVPLKLDKGEAGTCDKKEQIRYRERKKQLRRDTAIKLFNRYLQEGLSIEDQKDLTDAWNLKSNSLVNPDYTKIPVFIDGMCTHKGSKEFTLIDQQMKGISMLVNKGTGLLAYDVGLGKTVCGVAATVNQIQTGRAKKPLIAVPKAVYDNWIDNIHELFPNIKVNELGNLSKNYWKEGMKIEDGTISVCTYEGIENISFNDEEEEILSKDLEFAQYSESDSSKSDRNLAKKREKGDELLGEMSKTRDSGVQFSELGFDHITVDEIHNFRNLFKMPRNVKRNKDEDDKVQSNEFDGLGSGGDPSTRAKKLFAITQLIQEKNEGRNTFLLSATPFQNSPTEVYSILSYMARDKLKEMGYYSLEQFVGNFCKVQREYIVKANRVTEAPVVKGWENLSELQSLLTGYMDKVDGEEAGVVRPYKRMHAPELELTDLQKAIMKECSDYIEAQERKPKRKRDYGYMFKAINTMKNCALSPCLVNPVFIPCGYEIPKYSEFVDSSPKLKFVCDSIIKQYKQNNHNGQIMYMPTGVEHFPQVRDYLIKHGMPKESIGLVSGGAMSDKAIDARTALFKDFNNPDGKCKVIIGSSTIKEGCNLQGNTTSIYCTQLDWNPTDVQQLWGRGWRQGNKQGIVHCITPLMHDSLDPMIYQKHDEKSSRVNDLYSYKGDSLNTQDVNPEELKFALIKDPNKRANLQVMEFTEKNKSDEKMYGQLIDVLHKQIDIAFRDEKDIIQEVKNVANIPLHFNLEEHIKKIEELKENNAKIEKFAKVLEKKYKGKEGTFNSQDVADMKERPEGIYPYDSGVSGYEDIMRTIKRVTGHNKYDIEDKKNDIRIFKKKFKELKDSQIACKKYLESKGMKTREDCEAKIQDYVKLMDVAKDNVLKAKDMRAQFLTEAIAYNEANKKNLLSVDELVSQNVDSIMNDLHPMDDEWKAKIKAENDKRFGRDVIKSWCYFDKNGNLWFRKSAFITF